MKDNRNRQLATEITDFCIERLKSPNVKSKRARSIFQTALASFLALAFIGGGAELNRGSFWLD
jgi:hypothetical protein